jgi:NAD(P)-dependent dehydrogenase (short-subunit alcohol dehydrogenase family)
MSSLTGRIALVAGATRGAGRGIATALGEAGATVYCTGRSSRPPHAAVAPGPRPETIEETAERVTAAGGRGVPVMVDHADEGQVQALGERVRAEHGGLDLLVNDVWGGDALMEYGVPVWQMSIDKGRRMFESAVWTHLVNVRHLTPLLFGRERPLVVEVTDGDTFGYRGALMYDLVKMTIIRLAWDLAIELKPKGVTALSITPGFLRSEAMLELMGVTEQTWQQAANKDFAACSETPLYVGRAVAALAADPRVAERAGRVFSSWGLAREYGFTDADGRRPMWDEHFAAAYGRYPAADEAAFASWRDGPFELAAGEGYPTPEEITRLG